MGEWRNTRALPAWARPALIVLLAVVVCGLVAGGRAAAQDTGESGPSITVDRTEAARGAAIRVTGQGFDRASDSVIILINDTPVFRIPKSASLSTDGSFAAWIYVPDEAPFGTVTVTAEDVVTGKRSGTSSLAVSPLSQKDVVAKLDALLSEYFKTVPANPKWYEFMRNAWQSYRVTESGTVVPVSWSIVGGPGGVYSSAPSMVAALGPRTLVEELWPEGAYLPQWYQGQVLNWLAGMRFNPDPEKRALMDGFDYGPLVASSPAGSGGASDVSGDQPTHYFVGVWPHGPALEDGLAAALKPAWDTCGLALDPWPVQAPQVFQIRPGSGAWAETSSYHTRWSNAEGDEWLTGATVAPAAKEQLADRAARSPLLGNEYYSPPKASVPSSTSGVIASATGNDPVQALAGALPLTPVVRDSHSGELTIDGPPAGAKGIPGAEVLAVTTADGARYWFIGLPSGSFSAELTLAETATSPVYLKKGGGSVLAYETGALAAGTTATLGIADDAAAPELLAGATKVMAKDTGRRSVGLGGKTGGETGASWWPYAAGGGGLVVVIGLVVAVASAIRRRRREQAPSPQPIHLPEPSTPPPAWPPATPEPAPQPSWPTQTPTPPLSPSSYTPAPVPGAPPVAPAVHATLGRYEIVGVLGRGGMATVYRARHPGLGQDVAIKVLHSHLAADPSFVGRFQTEARAVAALRHPNIIRVLDFDAVNDTYFIVMEFVDGETLADHTARLVAEGRRPSAEETLRMFTPLCSALDYAHRQGMIHRDIKPSNILLTREGDPVLTDFGIARILGGTRYTMTGFVVGSAHYMSPEQAQDLTSDPRSDLYSLGVVLFETLTGRVPFEGDTTATVLLKHLTAPVPAARTLNPDLPEGIEEIMVKALAKDPNDRYQTGSSLAAALRAVLGRDEEPAAGEEAAEKTEAQPLSGATRVEAFVAPDTVSDDEPLGI